MRALSRLTLLLLALAAPLIVLAHDFEVDGICYNKNSDGTSVTVTYRGENFSLNQYSGSVTIPSEVIYNERTYSVAAIGEDAFNSCRGLTSVTIPNSVTTIGSSAFRYCCNLTSMSIPHLVTTIDYSTFMGCSGLTSVNIPNSVTTICSGAFSGCSSLISVTIPNSVTSIAGFAFEKCTYLQSIIIGDGVNLIGGGAFFGCSSLDFISVGANVEHIGNNAFVGCKALTMLYSYSVIPPICEATALDGLNKNNCQIYVPASGFNLYQIADQWKDFSKISPIDEGVVTKVRISASEATLQPDETIQLIAEILPMNATDKSVTWSSSDEAVAMVSADGLVTAIAEGRATITVTAASGVSASCVITVDAMNSIAELYADDCVEFDVYDLRGVVVGRNYTREQLNSLSRGIYIVNGRKVRIIGGPAL